jgi:hypothetical protein
MVIDDKRHCQPPLYLCGMVGNVGILGCELGLVCRVDWLGC